MPARPPMHGFTLLEVMVAMALMAVLALLSWRGLDSVLDSRERLVSASDDLGALSLTFAQLEEDLRRSWSVRLLGLPLPAIAFVPAVPGEGAPRLRLLREAYRTRPDTEIAAHLGEVMWVMGRHEEARQVWREGRARDAANEVLRETLARLQQDL